LRLNHLLPYLTLQGMRRRMNSVMQPNWYKI